MQAYHIKSQLIFLNILHQLVVNSEFDAVAFIISLKK